MHPTETCPLHSTTLPGKNRPATPLALIGLLCWLITPCTFAGALADAAMNREQATVVRLLADNINPDEAQVDGATALHWAAQWDNLDIASRLLAAGANVNATNREGATPLLLAAINGSAQMLDLLIDNGASVNSPLTTTGDTALMLTARTGLVPAVNFCWIVAPG